MPCTTPKNRIDNIYTLKDIADIIDTQPTGMDFMIVRDEDRDHDPYNKLSYSDCANQVRSLGNRLLDIGTRKGDKIGLMAENRLEWAVVYLAVTSIGAVIVPISILWEPPELEIVSNTGDLQLIFTSAAYLDKIAPIVSQVPHLKQVICFDPHPAIQKNPGFAYFPDFLTRRTGHLNEGKDHYSTVHVEPADIAEILFVSHTMGVMLSHGAIISNAKGLHQTLELEGKPGNKWMMLIPFSHLYPTVFGIILPLMAQLTLVTAPTPRMDHILRLIKETEPHSIILVPLLLERLYNRLEGRIKRKGQSLSTLGLHHMESIFVAGVKCPEEVIRHVEDIGLPVLEGYGLSEMAPFITMSRLNKRRIGSVGVALPNVEVKIEMRDTEGNGEILARGPNMMSGYYKQELSSKDWLQHGGVYVDAEGWLHTGDIGRCDPDGFIFITGRIRNIIVSKGGTNIYPRDIEKKLMENPLISRALVVLKWDEINGEYPFAYIWPNVDRLAALKGIEKEKLTEPEIGEIIKSELENLSGKIAAYKIPKSFEIVGLR